MPAWHTTGNYKIFAKYKRLNSNHSTEVTLSPIGCLFGLHNATTHTWTNVQKGLNHLHDI
jgi:hypothetical protein